MPTSPSPSSEPRPFQFGLKSLLWLGVGGSVYLSVARCTGWDLAFLFFSALLALRLGIILSARKPVVALLMFVVLIVIPIAAFFETIVGQWTTPFSRWRLEHWIGVAFWYPLIPTISLLVDLVFARTWNRRALAIRCVVEVLVVSPLWIMVIAAIVAKMGRVP